MAQFAYTEDGRYIVTLDGMEVLVYDGQTEAPLWRAFASQPLVGVGVSGTYVLTLGRRGELAYWDARAGQRVDTVLVPGVSAASALALGPGGQVAIVGVDAVYARAGEQFFRLPLPGAAAAAWSADGTRLALGARDGVIQVYAGAQLSSAGRGQLPVGAVRGLVGHPDGFWLATAGDAVYQVAADCAGGGRFTRAADMPLSEITCSADGRRIGIQITESLVLVMAYPSKNTLGNAQYLDRQVSGLAFGPASWLGVGLVGGDANKIDLATGAVHRTDPHPGRLRKQWQLKVAVAPKV